MSELPPCPKCGSEVEWTNSRDLNVLSSYIQCEGESCGLQVFASDSMAFPSWDEEKECIAEYELSVSRYCKWAATLPEQYCDEFWVHYTKKEG